MDVIDCFAPNAEDDHGEYWDPWDVMRVPLGGYSSEVDGDVIRVLRAIRTGLANSRADNAGHGFYCTEIAEALGLAPSHVELLQYMFCSAGWCEYGTSPRGCWFVHDKGENFGDRLIEAWEAYYLRHWGESAPA
jgi:hypothetical protein